MRAHLAPTDLATGSGQATGTASRLNITAPVPTATFASALAAAAGTSSTIDAFAALSTSTLPSTALAAAALTTTTLTATALTTAALASIDCRLCRVETSFASVHSAELYICGLDLAVGYARARMRARNRHRCAP